MNRAAERPTWESTYLEIAHVVARRGTCPRLQTGAVVVDSHQQVLSTGYNGAPRGQPHCTVVGCLMDGNHCVRALHAEENALYQAMKGGRSTLGSSIYVTHRSCIKCANAIVQAGVAFVYYVGPYKSDGLEPQVFDVFYRGGLSVRRYKSWKPPVESGLVLSQQGYYVPAGLRGDDDD